MKKIPTLFERVFDNHHKVGINNKVHPGMEWVLGGEGTATEKIDGSCCAVIDGVFYKDTMQNAARFRRRMRFPAAIRTP